MTGDRFVVPYRDMWAVRRAYDRALVSLHHTQEAATAAAARMGRGNRHNTVADCREGNHSGTRMPVVSRRYEEDASSGVLTT